MTEQAAPSKEAVLKDLEIQWKDHFHMRDQTWKVLTNTLLFFLGTIGLEIKGVTKFVMLCAYGSLLLIAAFGTIIAWHHRLRQRQKFAIIRMHEEVLGLYNVKRGILSEDEAKRHLIGTVFTVRFIEIVQLLISLIACVLFVAKALA